MNKPSMEYVSFNKNEFKTWEYLAIIEGYEIRDIGSLLASYRAFDKNGKQVGYFYNEYDSPNGVLPIGKLLVDISLEYTLPGLEAGLMTGYTIQLTSGEYVKSSRGTPVWWPSIDQALQTLQQVYYGHGARVVKVNLKRDPYAYNGHMISEGPGVKSAV